MRGGRPQAPHKEPGQEDARRQEQDHDTDDHPADDPGPARRRADSRRLLIGLGHFSGGGFGVIEDGRRVFGVCGDLQEHRAQMGQGVAARRDARSIGQAFDSRAATA